MFTSRRTLCLILLLVPTIVFGTQFGQIPFNQVIGAPTITNDSNVTLTLGGTPTDAVLKPFSLTLGWSGTLSIPRGGTNASTAVGALANLGGQPLDSDLTAIAALNTVAFGRGVLELSTAAGFRSYIGAGTSSFDGTFGSLTGKPTTLAGYGITDAEPALGNPSVSGYVLSSTTAGVRSWIAPATGGGSGTVTSFSSGNLSPLFTTSVATSTTTPALSFSLTNAAANTVFGNNTGASAAPGFQTLVDAQVPDILTLTGISNLTTNGFVKTSGGVGTLSVDTSTYLTSNQTITLSGDVTGSGATAITTTYNNAVPTAKGGAPSGGTTGQVLAKNTATSYDYSWATQSYEVPLTFSQSVSRAVNTVTLTNDSASPGNSKYYGTDSGGAKGYFALPAGGSGTVTSVASANTSVVLTPDPIIGTGTVKVNPAVDQAFTALQSITLLDAATATVTDLFTLDHESSGTPTNSFGEAIKFKLETSTTPSTDAGQLIMRWANAAHANRSAQLDVFLENNAGASLTKVATIGSLGEMAVGSSSTMTGLAGVISADTGFVVGGTKPGQGRFLQAVNSLDKYKDSVYGFPVSLGTAGTILQVSGSNYVSSTPTWPTTASTSGKVVKSDGTNLVMSTETYAVPSTSGQVMTSNGTNWISSQDLGTWDGELLVTGSDFTTTSTTITAITQLQTPTLPINSTYEFECSLFVNSTATTGLIFGIDSVGGSISTLAFSGTATAGGGTAVMDVGQNTRNVATAAFCTVAGDGHFYIRGFAKMTTGTPNLQMKIGKVTSGTATVYIGSVFHWKRRL